MTTEIQNIITLVVIVGAIALLIYRYFHNRRKVSKCQDCQCDSTKDNSNCPLSQ